MPRSQVTSQHFMEIFVSRNGEQIGSYGRQEAIAELKRGALRYDDLAWHTEDPNWKPLAEVLLFDAAVPSWGEIAATLPERQQPRVPYARVVAPPRKKQSSFGMGFFVLILLLGAGLFLYVRRDTPQVRQLVQLLQPDAASAPEPITTITDLLPPEPKDSSRPGRPVAGEMSPVPFVAPTRRAPPPAIVGTVVDNDETMDLADNSGEAMDPPAGEVASALEMDPGTDTEEPAEMDQPAANEVPAEYSRRPGLSGRRPAPAPADATSAPVAPKSSPAVEGRLRPHSVSITVRNSVAGSSSRGSNMGGIVSTRNQSREQNINITLHNFGHEADAVKVDWYFVGKPSTGSGKRFIYDRGSKNVEMRPGERTSLEATSEALEQTVQTGFVNRSVSGERPDGWIVMVRDDAGKLVAMEASSSSLKSIAGNASQFQELLHGGN